jgi:hypothetical protein
MPAWGRWLAVEPPDDLCMEIKHTQEAINKLAELIK